MVGSGACGTEMRVPYQGGNDFRSLLTKRVTSRQQQILPSGDGQLLIRLGRSRLPATDFGGKRRPLGFTIASIPMSPAISAAC
jgi:hypothetical protein